MAKWIPMLTGALKEGAQKLLSVFTKNKTDADKGTDFLDEPKAVHDSAMAEMEAQKESDRIITQPREIEAFPKPTRSPFDNKVIENPVAPEGAAPMSGRKSIPVSRGSDGPNDEEIKKELHEYAKRDKEASEAEPHTPLRDDQDRIEQPEAAIESNRAENQGEDNQLGLEKTPQQPPPQIQDKAAQETSVQPSESSSAPEVTVPVAQPRSSLPELPEWPKAIMESSGMMAGSHFGLSGRLTAAQPPSGEQLLGQLTGEAVPTPQTTQQSSVLDQAQGMGAEQVVGGYSRTEKLLELMMLRGIPTLKPPRGP